MGPAALRRRDVPAERRLADLESTLAQVKLDPAENAPLLAPLVDIPLPPDRAPSSAPEELRRRQLAAMTAWVLAGAQVAAGRARLRGSALGRSDLARSPARLAERGAQAPLLVVATTRPEFRAALEHALAPQRHLAGAARSRRRCATWSARSPPAMRCRKEVVEGVSERTGGVPLFVEEVTRLLLERGEQGGMQAIPPTFSSRLPRGSTGSARRARWRRSARCSGAISPMRCCATSPGWTMRRCKRRWSGSPTPTSCSSRALPPESDYRFKHALIQDAAYESLLKSRRQALHRRAAEILRDRFAERAAPSRKRSPIISRRRASTISRSNGGARRATRRCAARPSRRRSPISARRSRWRTRPATVRRHVRRRRPQQRRPANG